MSIPSRIFLVTGPSQLLFLGASINKDANTRTSKAIDTLVFVSKEYLQDQRSICETIARTIWDWDRILWLPDLGYFEQACKRHVISNITDEHVEQLWLCMPYNKIEVDFQSYFYDSDVVLYDDGLGSYLDPHTLLNYFRHPSILKKQIKLSCAKLCQSLCSLLKETPSSLPKFFVRKRYGLFAPFTGSSPKTLEIVEWSFLTALIQKIGATMKPVVTPTSAKCCLVAGQYFSLSGGIKRSQELECYIKVCKVLCAQGYLVYWKEHPKNKKPFYDELNAAVHSLYNFDELCSSYWPLEVALRNLDIELFVAATSTSLIILDQVYKISVKSFCPLLIGELRGADLQVANFIIKNFEPHKLWSNHEAIN